MPAVLCMEFWAVAEAGFKTLMTGRFRVGLISIFLASPGTVLLCTDVNRPITELPPGSLCPSSVWPCYVLDSHGSFWHSLHSYLPSDGARRM